MYDKMWGSSCPGHLVFMIDQSGSMYGENAQKTAECVQDSIKEVLTGCINGEEIKDRAYITVIGYGKDSTASIIREGWISEWAEDVLNAKAKGDVVIPAEADGGTPMTEAFKIAKSCLDTWIKAREEEHQDDPNEELAAPIVVNITDGLPNDEASARVAAQEILNTATPDGNVLLFNAHMSDDGVEIQFPSDKSKLNGVPEGEFLYEISSPLTDRMVNYAKKLKFETVRKGSMGFVANARKATLARFIEFGSTSSQKS